MNSLYYYGIIFLIFSNKYQISVVFFISLIAFFRSVRVQNTLFCLGVIEFVNQFLKLRTIAYLKNKKNNRN